MANLSKPIPVSTPGIPNFSSFLFLSQKNSLKTIFHISMPPTYISVVGPQGPSSPVGPQKLSTPSHFILCSGTYFFQISKDSASFLTPFLQSPSATLSGL